MMVVGGHKSRFTHSSCCIAAARRPLTAAEKMPALVPALAAASLAVLSQPPQPQPPVPPGGMNITVFHINEGSFGAAPINMNTGDALGDMYFDLRSKALAIECASNSSSAARDCDNQEVNPPASDPLVITKLVITVLAPFSPYGRCNVCVNGSDHHGNNSCADGVYWCSCGGYGSASQKTCAAGVGRENLTLHYAGRACEEGDPNYLCWKDASAKKLGGTWYSTTSTGYGSSWKVAEVVKRVSKACADDAMNRAVESAGSACFEACGPTGHGAHRNTSSLCWVECFESTVLGPQAGTPGGAISGMPIQDLLTAWNAPFESTDSAKSGCPSLPLPPTLPALY
jgi:hypothetical protein